MSEIAKQLREWAVLVEGTGGLNRTEVMRRAADHIEMLEAQLAAPAPSEPAHVAAFRDLIEHGVGALMVNPDGSVKHVPHSDIYKAPSERQPDVSRQTCLNAPEGRCPNPGDCVRNSCAAIRA